MQAKEISINSYSEKYREQILTVWEKSVLATHDFLTSTDFVEIKKLVNNINFNDFQVFCLTKENLVLGFIGVADKKVEMLFIDPIFFGQGLGQKLLNFAVKELSVDKVDVNEQNIKALKFYQKFGFETFERTDKDEQGKNYPLLRMKLIKSNNESKHSETNILQFKQAKQNDSELLTETAFKSKKIWNYSDEQMNLWTSDLTITDSYIQKNKVFKIYDNENYEGFFSLVYKEKHLEIDHFWLLPRNTKKGYGKNSFEFIKEMAKENNYRAIEVYAEPNSNGFYAKMGGKMIRKKESKIKGRFLNVYKFEI